MPKHSILLIEDIDCAFPSREEEEAREMIVYPGMPHSPPYHVPPRAAVTLSGLLNIIDGVGSEDGKIFFATVCIILSAPPIHYFVI
jgi:mitochondrial chaperone BCS1